MGVLRGKTDNPNLRLSYITRPMRLRMVSHRLVGPISLYIHCAPLSVSYSSISSFDRFDSAKVFYFLSILYYYYYYTVYDLILNLFEGLGIRPSVFSVCGAILNSGFYPKLLLCSRLIRDLDMFEGLSFGPWMGTEKVWCFLILLYIPFCWKDSNHITWIW
jgi:hypothetical protein